MLESVASGLRFMAALDNFHGIAIGIAAKQCFSPRFAQTVGYAGIVQMFPDGIDGIGGHGEMPVPATMRRPAGGWIRVFQLQQMYLLPPHLQPCTGKAHIGPLRQRQIENAMIEFQCFLGIGDQQADVVQGEVEF